MSGVRRARGPRYRKSHKWGPEGWYCCDGRLMAAAELGNGNHLRTCRHCGAAIVVAGNQFVDYVRAQDRHPITVAELEQGRLPI